MTSTTLLSDIVFPAATWYEKHDLSSTDMHPFVHAFTPAIDPPWEAKTRLRAFHLLARELSRGMAETHLGVRKDLVSVPLQHDTPGETAQPGGVVRDWTGDDVARGPGQNMPAFTVVERDYTAIADKLAAVGPLADTLGFTVKNVTYRLEEQLDRLGRSNGVMLGGAADGRPAIDTDAKMAEAILTFSGTTNGELAVQGFRTLEKRRSASCARPGRGVRGEADHLRPDPGRAGAGDHLAGVVRLGDRRPPLRPVHGQHRTAQAVPHPDRPDALLPRPRLDDATSARRCRSTGRRWTCTGCSASPSSVRTAPGR